MIFHNHQRSDFGEVLGHRCTQTTRRYAHLTESHTHSKVRDILRAIAEEISDEST